MGPVGTLLAGLAVVGLAAAAAADGIPWRRPGAGVPRTARTAAGLPFRCPRNDANLSQCVGAGFVKIINTMTVGRPEWAVRVLDPLLVPLMPVNKDAGEVLNLNMTFIDMFIRHIARDVVLKAADFDLDKMDLTMVLQRPRVEFDGRYKMAGKILWLPIWGSGTFNIKMSRGVKEVFKLRGEKRVNEAGRPYWHVTDFSSSLSPTLMTVQFKNLFNGNPLLGFGANALMNAEWKQIYGQLHPITDAHFSSIMKPQWTEILKAIPLDEAFPEA